MIRREVTTLSEVIRNHSFWAMFEFIICAYLHNSLFLILPVIGVVLLFLFSFFMKRKHPLSLVDIKNLQGISALLHAVVCSLLFSILVGVNIKGTVVLFAILLVCISFIIIIVNFTYDKLKRWETSEIRSKLMPIMLGILLAFGIVLRFRAPNDINFASKVYTATMTFLQCVFTTNFSRAKELKYNKEIYKE